MDLVRFAISRPVAVTVGLILIVIFGFIGLNRLPYQLTPNVNKPEISVITTWAGATPYEVESEIIEPQEKALKNLEGLEEYESTASTGRGRITLRFELGTDLQKALLDVSNSLNEVSSYPENVLRPIIRATGETTAPAIWMMVQAVEDNPKDIATYLTFLENEITEHFERIEGVSELFVRGGVADELHIIVDPLKLAAYNLSVDQIVTAVQRENIDISAGDLDLGRRTYRVRTAAKFQHPDQVANLVLLSDGMRRVLLSDVAQISLTNTKKTGLGLFLGKPGIAIGVRPEATANVVAMTNEVEAVFKRLNETVMPKHGLRIVWAYDQRPYIMGAISLVQQNIAVGALLAVLVLLVFLRAVTPTGVVAIAIPMSVIGTFIVLDALDRSLNIISLAGISFAVGMLVDSAIVVLENIDRHKQMGKRFRDAAYDGTVEVWGALIISALTTIAVFAPIIFLADEAGQLFKDIAIAVTAAVSFSLFISVFAIPMLWRQMMHLSGKEMHEAKEPGRLERIGARLSGFFMALVDTSLKNHATRLGTVGGLTALSILTVWALFPKMEYLPEGNRNMIQNIFIPPPGLSYAETEQIGLSIFERIMPHVGADKDGYPAIQRAFFIGAGSFMFMGAATVEEDRAAELIGLFKPIVNSFPGIMAITKQAGVFERGLGTSRSVNVDISGDNMDAVVAASGTLFGAVREGVAGAQVRPVPSIELIYPEVTILPKADRLKAAGMDARSLGIAADVFMEGRKISEYQGDGIKKIDIILKSNNEAVRTPEDLSRALIATPKGGIVPLSQLGEVRLGQGMTEIRHFNGKRTITLQVTPPKEITIQEVMERVEGQIVPAALKGNDAVQVRLSGTADKLLATVSALKWNFVLAVVITYLLMAALFGNFIYPLIILFTVPLATAGGFVGLKMTNLLVAPQALDILTMLGFIILVGIVVNNAILIVHQSLNFIRYEGMEHLTAIRESVRTRLRPIYMSSLTSVFGMLPLVLVPGPGSEMYRGLGSVITGGLLISTLFVVFVIPTLLAYVIKMEKIGGGDA
ncbi:MAG: efflux RND transporter permease subunit [Campylobacterales bacterium]